MCIICWVELDIKPVVNEKVVRAYKLVGELYELEGGGVGGAGHIVFDDWNIDDGSIDSCLQGCDDKHSKGSLSEEVVETSRAALLYFRVLTEAERYTALAFHGKELDIFDFVDCL